jgi:hypothetical protein
MVHEQDTHFIKDVAEKYGVDMDVVAEKASDMTLLLYKNMTAGDPLLGGMMEIVKEKFTQNELAFMALHDFLGTLKEILGKMATEEKDGTNIPESGL